MQGDLEGIYLDGGTAVRHRAAVRFLTAGVQIVLEGGETLFWPRDEVRQARGLCQDGQIRLERGGETPEILLISGALFQEGAKGLLPPGWRGRFRGSLPGKSLAMAILLSGAAAAGAAAFLYLSGIPGLASFLASRIPASWEERIGEPVVNSLAPPEHRCANSARARRVEEILSLLAASLPRSPYAFRTIVVDRPEVNAFAAPGGTIVIFQGLLEKTSCAEELAGVLAHEMQHVLQRHATRALVQQVSLKVLLAAVAGDARGLAYGLEGAQALGMLRYSREIEEEADREAVRMLLAAGIDPRGFIAFFEAVRKESEKAFKIPVYLSTHPDLEERILLLKSHAGSPSVPQAKLLAGYDWRDIHGYCPPRQGR